MNGEIVLALGSPLFSFKKPYNIDKSKLYKITKVEHVTAIIGTGRESKKADADGNFAKIWIS